ncbi:STAS domain-containing protein [Aliikangiella sp. IMCC44359]|uniref:STAS domain-containing protein n=1 Tax=Aliikangiella sp. IMCC44359 TaxID=3459125 RepID=UPI00403B09C5
MYKLESKKLKKGHRIVIKGEMSIYSAKSIYQELKGLLSFEDRLLLDLNNVTEFDSAGIQLMLLLQRESEKCNVSIEIEKKSIVVDDLFKLFNIEKKFRENSQ